MCLALVRLSRQALAVAVLDSPRPPPSRASPTAFAPVPLRVENSSPLPTSMPSSPCAHHMVRTEGRSRHAPGYGRGPCPWRWLAPSYHLTSGDTKASESPPDRKGTRNACRG